MDLEPRRPHRQAVLPRNCKSRSTRRAARRGGTCGRRAGGQCRLTAAARTRRCASGGQRAGVRTAGPAADRPSGAPAPRGTRRNVPTGDRRTSRSGMLRREEVDSPPRCAMEMYAANSTLDMTGVENGAAWRGAYLGRGAAWRGAYLGRGLAVAISTRAGREARAQWAPMADMRTCGWTGRRSSGRRYRARSVRRPPSRPTWWGATRPRPSWQFNLAGGVVMRIASGHGALGGGGGAGARPREPGGGRGRAAGAAGPPLNQQVRPEDGPAAGASGQLGRHGFHAQRGERRGTRALLGCFAAGAQTYVSLSWADEVARASAPPLNIRTTVTGTMAAGLWDAVHPVTSFITSTTSIAALRPQSSVSQRRRRAGLAGTLRPSTTRRWRWCARCPVRAPEGELCAENGHDSFLREPSGGAENFSRGKRALRADLAPLFDDAATRSSGMTMPPQEVLE